MWKVLSLSLRVPLRVGTRRDAFRQLRGTGSYHSGGLYYRQSPLFCKRAFNILRNSYRYRVKSC